MLYYDYFSHWDTQGYKPYVRYTLLGGQVTWPRTLDWIIVLIPL